MEFQISRVLSTLIPRCCSLEERKVFQTKLVRHNKILSRRTGFAEKSHSNLKLPVNLGRIPRLPLPQGLLGVKNGFGT